MGLSCDYDCASSILLCSEDNNSILGFDDDDDDDEVVHQGEIEGHEIKWSSEMKRTDFYGDFFKGFPLQSDECMSFLVERETHHLPRGDYAERLLNGALDISIRRDAIDWIWKVNSYYSFGPLTAYLSVNYLDRFLSAYELPQGKAWMTQLLSVACLSLASKMEETEIPLSLDLQVGEAKYVFEAKTIRRMELLVLSTLKWRMQAVTPFSFVDYFLEKFNDDNSATRALISRSMEPILNTVRGIDFLVFKPSEIAAAVALSVLVESRLIDVEKSLACCNHVEKERVMRCYEVIQGVSLVRNMAFKNGGSPSVSSVPQSPIGVLDATCLSYRSDDVAAGSQENFPHDSPAVKRRKISSRPADS